MQFKYLYEEKDVLNIQYAYVYRIFIIAIFYSFLSYK